MAAIVPLTALADTAMRRAFEAHGAVVGTIAFPGRAFAKHGTSVETGLLVVDRAPARTWDGLLHQPDDWDAMTGLIRSLSPRSSARPRLRVEIAATSLLAPRDRGLALPSGRLGFLAGAAPLAYAVKAWSGEGRDVGLYQAHALARIDLPDPRPHPSPLVESGPMASVAPPAPTYRPVLPPTMRRPARPHPRDCRDPRLCRQCCRMLPGALRRARGSELPGLPAAGGRAVIAGMDAGHTQPEAGDDDLLTRKEASAFLVQFGIRMKPETLARLWSTGAMVRPAGTFGTSPTIRGACSGPGPWPRSATCAHQPRPQHGGVAMADPQSQPVSDRSMPTVADLLVDAAVSFALKDVLRAWEMRDPVDAALDARILADLLERRADEAVSWAP